MTKNDKDTQPDKINFEDLSGVFENNLKIDRPARFDVSFLEWLDNRTRCLVEGTSPQTEQPRFVLTRLRRIIITQKATIGKGA